MGKRVNLIVFPSFCRLVLKADHTLSLCLNDPKVGLRLFELLHRTGKKGDTKNKKTMKKREKIPLGSKRKNMYLGKGPQPHPY